jgi:hypothetical protein
VAVEESVGAAAAVRSLDPVWVCNKGKGGRRRWVAAATCIPAPTAAASSPPSFTRNPRLGQGSGTGRDAENTSCFFFANFFPFVVCVVVVTTAAAATAAAGGLAELLLLELEEEVSEESVVVVDAC